MKRSRLVSAIIVLAVFLVMHHEIAQAADKDVPPTQAPNKEKPIRRNTSLPVPLTQDLIDFVAADPAKQGARDRFVAVNEKGQQKQEALPDKIVVSLRNSGGKRHLLVRISLLSDRDDFLRLLNERRKHLIDLASGTLSAKTLEELNRIGERRLLATELQKIFNQSLSGELVQEVIQRVIIHEFVMQ